MSRARYALTIFLILLLHGTHERSSYPKHGLVSGTLYSTVDDLAKFLSLFFSEGPAGGKQVLGSSSLLEMLIPVAVSTDIRRDDGNVFYIDGGSFYGSRMTFESNKEGSTVLK